MKKFYLIFGGIVCVMLVIFAMYVALTLGLSVYTAWSNQMRMKKYQTYADAVERGDAQPPTLGQPWDPDARPAPIAPVPPPQKILPLFTDPGGYGNEDDWLATTICREITEMAFFAAHSDQSLPVIKVHAQVDATKPLVQVEVNGFGSGSDTQISADLSPTFAWDNEGYAPLAARLLGLTQGTSAEPVSATTDALSHLLWLSASELALEDMRISSALQQNPVSWQAHEQAAVLLVAMALREQGGDWGDSRTFLCRAAAHLALARALRGNQPAGWPGLIADAGVRTMAGREVDALAHLDVLSARNDCPGAAKTWIAALRTRAKEDWREAEVKPDSPLLLKIVWFQALHTDLTEDVVTQRLLKIVPQPAVDPAAAPDPNQGNPETLVADWGRIASASPFNNASDDDVKNGEYKLDVELHELGEILTIEHGGSVDLSGLGQLFSEAETDTVANDNAGKPIVRVVGAATFKADSLRHLLAGIPSKSPIPVPTQDPAQMEIFLTKIDGLFKGVPSYNLLQSASQMLTMDERVKIFSQWAAAGKTVPVWKAPYNLTLQLPGRDIIESFYRRAVPFGTVYNPGQRIAYIETIGGVQYPAPDPVEMTRIKQLPIDQQQKASYEYNTKFNAMLRTLDPKGPSVFVQSLLKLDPDNYFLATDRVPTDQLLKEADRFLDYVMWPMERIGSLDAAHLDDAGREAILRKRAVFAPQMYLDLGLLLRYERREDEAVAVERQGLAEAAPEWSSNFYERIVDYDLDHGLTDEALALGKKASVDTSSEAGLDAYFDALESSGRLDEAKVAAHQVSQLFDDTWPEIVLFSGHPDKFPDDNAAELKRIFPDGIQKAELGSFSGPPMKGMRLDDDDQDERTNWILEPAHLKRGDIMVALDGYRTDTAMQYFYIQARGHGPDMNFILWRDGKYQEVKAYVPHRRFLLSVDQVQGP